MPITGTPVCPTKLISRHASDQNRTVNAGSSPSTSGSRLRTISSKTASRLPFSVKTKFSPTTPASLSRETTSTPVVSIGPSPLMIGAGSGTKRRAVRRAVTLLMARPYSGR